MVWKGVKGIESPVEKEVEGVGSPVKEELEGVGPSAGSWLSSQNFFFLSSSCMPRVIFCLVLAF